MNTEKQKDEKCRHFFQLSSVDTKRMGTAVGGFFYKTVAYSVCEKCGLIIEQIK